MPEFATSEFHDAALGEPIGSPQRWLSPTTNGVRLLAVHTPRLGGVVHRCRADGARLGSHVVIANVTNHMIGRRDLDMSAWVGQVWAVPAQDRGSLRFLDFEIEGAIRIRHGTAPSGRVKCNSTQPGVAVLQQDGGVAWASRIRATRLGSRWLSE